MPDDRDRDLQLENRDVRSASSFKAEIHFIGQIVGGTFFDQGNDGLICEVQLQAGDHWKMFGPEMLNQSQTSYADPGDMVVWAHPFDLHFGSDSIFGWPRLDIRIWRLDVYGKVDIGNFILMNSCEWSDQSTKLVRLLWARVSYLETNWELERRSISIFLIMSSKTERQSIDKWKPKGQDVIGNSIIRECTHPSRSVDEEL